MLETNQHCVLMKVSPLNGVPLSDFITSGIPLRVRMLSNLGMTACGEVDSTFSTNGNLLYSSITTNRN